MKESVRQAIKDAIEHAPAMYSRLILLAGPSGSGKTQVLQEIAAQYDTQIHNVNLFMSKALLEIPVRRHQSQAARVFSDIIRDLAGNERSETAIVLLDNLEILFDKDLMLDPLSVLQGVSRNCAILASWNGTFSGKRLTFAISGHPEYRCYDAIDAQIIPVGAASGDPSGNGGNR